MPTYRNSPDWKREHIKSDARGTTWCGLTYGVTATRKVPRTGKPLCQRCESVQHGDTEPGSPPRLFGYPR